MTKISIPSFPSLVSMAKTYAVENDSHVTGKAGDEVPVRLLHSSGIGILSRIGRAESPLETGDDEDREDEAERPCEHRSGEAGEGDSGRGIDAVLGEVVGVDIAGRDVPQWCSDGSSEDDEEEGQSEGE